MKDYYYYVVEIERNGQRLAYIKKIGHGNLVSMFPDDAKIIHPVDSLKEAHKTARAWNNASRENGYNFCLNCDPIKYGTPIIEGRAYWE